MCNAETSRYLWGQCWSGPFDRAAAAGLRSEDGRSSFFTSWLLEDMESWLSLALELVVLLRYPSRDAPCLPEDCVLEFWSVRVPEVMSALKHKQRGFPGLCSERM